MDYAIGVAALLHLRETVVGQGQDRVEHALQRLGTRLKDAFLHHECSEPVRGQARHVLGHALSNCVLERLGAVLEDAPQEEVAAPCRQRSLCYLGSVHTNSLGTDVLARGDLGGAAQDDLLESAVALAVSRGVLEAFRKEL